MPKHRIQNLAEQIAQKGHGESPFHTGRTSQIDESMNSEDNQKKFSLDDSSVRLKAYQIYKKKGGTPLDNWLEAKRILHKEGI